VWVYLDPQQWTLEVHIPQGVTAEVVLPEPFAGKRVRVTEKAGPVAGAKDGAFSISAPGRYVFAAE
jgi:hypothetical protein